MKGLSLGGGGVADYRSERREEVGEAWGGGRTWLLAIGGGGKGWGNFSWGGEARGRRRKPIGSREAADACPGKSGRVKRLCGDFFLSKKSATWGWREN